MLLGTRLALLALLMIALALPAPAGAQDPAPSHLALTVTPQPQYADEAVTLAVDLTDDTGGPVVGAQVTLQRSDGSAPEVLVTDGAGHAQTTATMARSVKRNAWTASYAGDATYAAATDQATARLDRRASTVGVGGPHQVVDEQSIQLTVHWRTSTGTPVPGPVVLQRRAGDRWVAVATLRTGHDGRAATSVRPRSDTVYRAVAHRLAWVEDDRSGPHRVDNLPPGTPVSLPADAPRPRVDLPDQAHATGDGPHPVISRVPDGVWRQMTGRTWHAGCPVGRSGLRLLRINYWDYRGYRRRGELVAATSAVDNMAGALAEMYRRELPLRSLYREDRFGWSDRLHGADDYRSMAAGNTSAFNCRGVVGNPGTRSPHAYGRALDVNTWENPYRSAQGTVPNTWWQHHSHPRVAWRSRSHVVVEVMARHGLRWTYGIGDTQHFDVSYGAARMVTAPDEYVACNGVCD